MRRIALAVLAAIALSVAVSMPAHASAGQDTLWAGQTLTAGQTIVSASGFYKAAMQSDGNFVVYSPVDHPLWQSGTHASNARLAMQTDGNLVVYGPNAIWANLDYGSGAKLVMQNDGNLVEYGTAGVLWATNTWAAHQPYDTTYKGFGPVHMYQSPNDGDHGAAAGLTYCSRNPDGSNASAVIYILPNMPDEFLRRGVDHEWGHTQQCLKNFPLDEHVADCIADIDGFPLPPGYTNAPGYGCDTDAHRATAHQILGY